MSSTGARARLKAGHIEIQKLTAEVAELKAAVESAHNAIAEDEQTLASFSDLDAAITKYRVSATRRRQDARKLPDDLRARVDAKRSAEEELEQARTTLDVLTKDLLEAEATLRSKRTGLSRLAVAVVQEVADVAAGELIKLSDRYAYLCAVLEGLSHAQVLINQGDILRGIPHTDTISEALSQWGYADPVPGISAEMALGKRWEFRVKALMDNPDAVVNLPQPVGAGDIVIKTPMFLGAIGSFDLRPEE